MPPMRTSLKSLSSETRFALAALKAALAKEPGVYSVQVTFDNVKATGIVDVPPTVDIIWEP